MAKHEPIDINLCLSDIPEDRKFQGKNGKTYVNFRVKQSDKPDNYGNTHTGYLPQTKEQKDRNEYPTKIANGKFYDKSKSQQSSSGNAGANSNGNGYVSDNLPY